MNILQGTALHAFVILAVNYAFSESKCNSQGRRSLDIIGVFDFGDMSSVEGFSNAILRHNSLKQEECDPILTYRTLLIKSETSVSELIDLADEALQGGSCFMVYAAEHDNGRVVLDLAIGHGLKILTAIQEVSMILTVDKKKTAEKGVRALETEVQAITHSSVFVSQSIGIHENSRRKLHWSATNLNKRFITKMDISMYLMLPNYGKPRWFGVIVNGDPHS